MYWFVGPWHNWPVSLTTFLMLVHRYFYQWFSFQSVVKTMPKPSIMQRQGKSSSLLICALTPRKLFKLQGTESFVVSWTPGVKKRLEGACTDHEACRHEKGSHLVFLLLWFVMKHSILLKHLFYSSKQNQISNCISMLTCTLDESRPITSIFLIVLQMFVFRRNQKMLTLKQLKVPNALQI